MRNAWVSIPSSICVTWGFVAFLSGAHFLHLYDESGFMISKVLLDLTCDSELGPSLPGCPHLPYICCPLLAGLAQNPFVPDFPERNTGSKTRS